MSKLEVKVEETPFRASVLRETTKCKESVHVQEKIRKRPKTEVKICKLLFPRKSVYQKCKHVHDVIVERNMLTRTDHSTDLLAQPRTYVVEKTPCWVERSISRCTPHLKDLAQPNLQRSIEEKHLSNNIQKEMNKPCLSPKKALRALKLRIKCRRLRINSQQRRIEKLCQRWRESNCELLRKFSTTRLWSRVIMEDNLVSHSSADKADFKYSKVILNEICELMSQKSPTRKPTDCVDEAILQIADKVNLWMIGVLDKSDFWKLETTTDESGCSEELIESCLHNEQNMHVEEDPLTISHGKSLRSPKDTEKVLSPKSSQRKLSFLRKSQIIIDPQTCREIFDRIGQIKKLKVEKEQRKLSRQMKTTNVKNQHLVFSSQQNGKPKNVNQKVDPKSKKGGNRPETDKNILECTPNEGLIWDVQWVKK